MAFNRAVKWLGLAVIVLALGACNSVSSRAPFSPDQVNRAGIEGFRDIRLWADAPASVFRGEIAEQERQERAAAGGRPRDRIFHVLALSGGADDGAYGAGFLAGWTARGDRPQFDLVSGVSTGALIAPLAFLGPSRDQDLKRAYTEIDASQVFEFRGLAGLLGDGLASTAPLRKMVAGYIDERLLAEVAAEHRKGRRLIAITTNLDAQRPVLWNLGAIAASGDPRALNLFRDVVIASASVPGVFEPVLLEAVVDGQRIREMHVDGGTMANTFAMPWTMYNGRLGREGRRLQLNVIANGRVDPEFQMVPESTLRIGARAMQTLMKAHNQATLREIRRLADSNGGQFQLTSIERDFTVPYDKPFQRPYMNALYAYGFERGRLGNAWRSSVQNW
ncbi:patatin-like phospholipase family protein [Phreatobacter aquaticus]|uniref:patatin-like phospholipase family protein n=1 Tax=Phreatobacter aquaticus TaxID=2570229 RepID=UPI00143DA72C|nr:patatin-like phospholipase family protein [Phreatobacter aquaticus]